jgi:hypothetical protein
MEGQESVTSLGINEGACDEAFLLSRRWQLMSSDGPADYDEDRGHASFILMRATETFDGQERVMSRAAYDLQVLATTHSVSCGSYSA